MHNLRKFRAPYFLLSVAYFGWYNFIDVAILGLSISFS